MKFGTTRSQFYDAQKSARAKWDAVGDDWDDAIRREHGEKIVEELDRAVSDVLAAIDQLATVFVQVRHECEFPDS